MAPVTPNGPLAGKDLRWLMENHAAELLGLAKSQNGRFPLLALESARQLGLEITVIAIQEEASKEVESLASRCHWISLGQLGKMIDICKQDGITEVMMCGQVKHAKIFSSIAADWRLLKLMLLQIKMGEEEKQIVAGIRAYYQAQDLVGRQIVVVSNLQEVVLRGEESHGMLLAASGVMTLRQPEKEEIADIAYGRRVANALAGFDVGQSVAICERACVAVEAMEGTDAMLRRAATLVNGRRMAMVKVARRREHLLFDVPVVGLDTIPAMRETGTTVLAVEAGRTLMLDKQKMIDAANAAGIAIVGQDE